MYPDFPSFLEVLRGWAPLKRRFLLQYIKPFRPSSERNREDQLSKKNVETLEGFLARKAKLLEEVAKKESAKDFLAGRRWTTPGFSNYTQEPLREMMSRSAPKTSLTLVAILPKDAHDALFQFTAHLEDGLINGNGKGGKIQGLLSQSEVATRQESDEGLAFYESKIETHLYRYGAKQASDHIVVLNPTQKGWLEQQKDVRYQADTCELCKAKVLESELMPEGRGLIITPDEIQLNIGPDSKWDIDSDQDAKIVLHCWASIEVEPDALSVLGNLNS